MPAKKREVISFVTRLNPALVRKLDAYADIVRQSRNQVIESWLEEHFQLHRELSSYREFERAVKRSGHEEEDAVGEFKYQGAEEEYEKICKAEKQGEGSKKKPAGK